MDKERDYIIRNMLQLEDLAGILLWRPDEILMATGYQPLWGISVCIYPRLGEPVLYIPEYEPKDQLPQEGFIIKYFPWGPVKMANPWDFLYQLIAVDLKSFNSKNLPISFIPHSGQSAPAQNSAEQPSMPGDFQEKIKNLIKGGFKDCTAPIHRLYGIKTIVEIEKIILANQVAAIGLKTFYKNLIPGKTEADLAAAVEFEIQSQIGKNNIFYAKAWPFIMSGINSCYGGTFSRSTGKKLKKGDLVIIEMAVCVNGYWCDLTRTGAVGKISKEFRAVYNTVTEAQKMGLAAIKPGQSGGDVDKKVRGYIKRKGYEKFYNHALGHHVGFRYHDPNPGLFPKSDLMIEEGMVLTVEPGIYGTEIGCGCRIEDNILVTSDGIKILSQFSAALNGID